MRIYLQCRTSSLEGNLAGESFDPPLETHFVLQFASDQLSSADKSSVLGNC
jgi:hypothetical protein